MWQSSKLGEVGEVGELQEIHTEEHSSQHRFCFVYTRLLVGEILHLNSSPLVDSQLESGGA